MDNRVIDALKGPVRVLLMATFLLLSKMGVITYATPEAMHTQVNAILDFLVVAAPIFYAGWVYLQAMRASKPENIVAKAAALPQVKQIVATTAIADAVPGDTVITMAQSLRQNSH